MTKKRKRPSLGQTMGGIIVGFDQQIFRTTPPPHELVQKGQPVRGLSGEGHTLEVIFPDDGPAVEPPATPLVEATIDDD
ncbi:MAG TPA: hypothetical protein VD763_02705 [Candidatus Saccharimonadales bacterium]|nr:hypothetical protein [Candidatus Saccharimonadales bacterium]